MGEHPLKYTVTRESICGGPGPSRRALHFRAAAHCSRGKGIYHWAHPGICPTISTKCLVTLYLGTADLAHSTTHAHRSTLSSSPPPRSRG